MHTTAKPRAEDTVSTVIVPLFPRLAWGSERSAFDENAADARITAQVRTAFQHCPALRLTRLNVETTQGTVSLSGFAESSHGKVRAGALAGRVDGVRRVENGLLVR